MVSRTIAAVLITFFAAACGPNLADNTIPGGSTPVLTSLQPSAVSPGSTVEITGAGFSLVAPENVVLVGNSSVSAESYSVTEDGSEKISFQVPAGLSSGDNSVLVVVEGEASNALTLTIAP